MGILFMGDNCMNKEYITKISKKDAENCNRPDLVGKNIVLYESDKLHCYSEHYKNFKNKKEFGFVMNNLDFIINECDFVLFNCKNKSLEYYKKLNSNITVRVRVEDSNELKIKTMFPVSESKYEMKMTRYAYNKYVIQDDEKELATN